MSVNLFFDGTFVSKHLRIELAVKRAESHSCDVFKRLTASEKKTLKETLKVQRIDFMMYEIKPIKTRNK